MFRWSKFLTSKKNNFKRSPYRHGKIKLSIILFRILFFQIKHPLIYNILLILLIRFIIRITGACLPPPIHAAEFTCGGILVDPPNPPPPSPTSPDTGNERIHVLNSSDESSVIHWEVDNYNTYRTVITDNRDLIHTPVAPAPAIVDRRESSVSNMQKFNNPPSVRSTPSSDISANPDYNIVEFYSQNPETAELIATVIEPNNPLWWVDDVEVTPSSALALGYDRDSRVNFERIHRYTGIFDGAEENAEEATRYAKLLDSIKYPVWDDDPHYVPPTTSTAALTTTTTSSPYTPSNNTNLATSSSSSTTPTVTFRNQTWNRNSIGESRKEWDFVFKSFALNGYKPTNK